MFFPFNYNYQRQGYDEQQSFKNPNDKATIILYTTQCSDQHRCNQQLFERPSFQSNCQSQRKSIYILRFRKCGLYSIGNIHQYSNSSTY